MEYLCKITEAFADQADPAFAKLIKQDFDAINGEPNWWLRARQAESVLLRLFDEVGRKHVETLARLAKKR